MLYMRGSSFRIQKYIDALLLIDSGNAAALHILELFSELLPGLAGKL